MTWYLDKRLNVLRNQLKIKYPGMVFGTIGDSTHQTENPSSDHNPEADSSVDGEDLMIGPAFTKEDAQYTVEALVESRDWGIKYIIWNRHIISGDAGPAPWVWRNYYGKDPHTGHVHVSRNDVNENSEQSWKIVKDNDMISPAQMNELKAHMTAAIASLNDVDGAAGERTLRGSINALATPSDEDFTNPIRRELEMYFKSPAGQSALRVALGK